MPEPTIPLSPQQAVTLLRHQVHQARMDFQQAETAANARELATKLTAYADAVDAAEAAKPRPRRRRVPSSADRLAMARSGHYADGVQPGDL